MKIRFKLNLNIAGVEQMFRHFNLIQELAEYGAPPLEDVGIGESTTKGGEKDRIGEPINYPDFEADGKDNQEPRYILWVHGFNVNGQQVRGWHSEIFKRLYWSGSKARFVGVSWYGFEAQPYNYYVNVDHAFMTSSVFGQRLRQVTGERPVTIVAHSLGNILVSSYLNDYHEKLDAAQKPNIDKYIMLDAAVALEAYLGDYQNYAAGKGTEEFDAINPMVHSDWYGYQKRLGTSEWYTHFDDNNAATITDYRETLTWRNRFSGLPEDINYYSFFSTGEDVLATLVGDGPTWDQLDKGQLGRYSWAIQEKWKGRAVNGLNGVLATTVMGWGFNLRDYLDYAYDEAASDNSDRMYNANTNISNGDLITKPFFRVPSSVDVSPTLFDPVIGGPGSDYAKAHHSWLLAEAIPALTLPTGGHEGEAMSLKVGDSGIINMNSPLNKNGWPVERANVGDFDWWHSDIKDVAFPFTFKVINELLQKGGSN